MMLISRLPHFSILIAFLGSFFCNLSWSAVPTRTPSLSRRPGPATLIFFTGGVGNFLSEIGPELIQSTIDPNLQVGQNRNYLEHTEVCAEIASRDLLGPLILVGHSFGAHAAILVAQCLSDVPLRSKTVDLLVALDTRKILFSATSAHLIPANVIRVFNIHQGSGLLPGENRMVREQSGGIDGIISIPVLVSGIFPHSALDNRTLPLTQTIVSWALDGALNCLNLDQWNERQPLDTRLLENPSFIQSIITNSPECLARNR